MFSAETRADLRVSSVQVGASCHTVTLVLQIRQQPSALTSVMLVASILCVERHQELPPIDELPTLTAHLLG